MIMVSSAGYYKPQRKSNEIVLYLSPMQPTPPVPFELQGYVPEVDWQTRLPTIARTAARYSKPLFERAWALLALLSIIILPIALFNIIASKLIEHNREDEIRMNAEARALSFGIFIAVALVFFLPMLAWKYIGHLQVQRLLSRWAKADRMTRGQNVALPTWKVKTPGLLRDIITLTITLPMDRPPSTFHPDAYLPSYINGPTDSDSAYFYPYNKGERGLPHMSVVGNVPLFMDEKSGSVAHRV